jgi:site-specific DNA recombinase
MKRAALYARVSGSDSPTSLEGQLASCRDYAAQLGYAVVKEVAEEVSGALFNRRGMDELLEMASNRQFDALILAKVDRLGRESLVHALLEAEFKAKGVEVLFVGRDSSTKEGRLLINIERDFAVWERERIVERLVEGRRNKILGGKVLGGGKTSFGYRWVPGQGKGPSKVDGYLEIHEVEAHWVRLIFKWAVHERQTLYQITRLLDEGGAPSRNGRPWNISTVHTILRNPIYTGVWVWNKYRKVVPKAKRGEVVIGHAHKTAREERPRDEWLSLDLPHLALIDQRTYDLAQEQLEANKRNARRNARSDYLLRSVLLCGECGYRYHGATQEGHIRYACGGARGRFVRTHGNPCKARSVKARALEDFVWQAVVRRLCHPERFEVGSSADSRKRQQETNRQELVKIEAYAQKLDQQADHLLKLTTDPDMMEIAQAIGAVKLKEQAESLRKGRAHVEAQRSEILRRIEAQEADYSAIVDVRRYAKLFRRYLLEGLPPEERRVWIERLKIKVTLYPDTIKIEGLIHHDVFPRSSLLRYPRFRVRRLSTLLCPPHRPSTWHMDRPVRVWASWEARDLQARRYSGSRARRGRSRREATGLDSFCSGT